MSAATPEARAAVNEALRALMPPPPGDMPDAAERLGAKCGHGALAAALGISVAAAVDHLKKPGWISVPLMKAGIVRAGRCWERVEKPDSFQTGLILLQFTGPWTEPDAFWRKAYEHRHWIAARRGFVWDANRPGRWQTQAEWHEFFRRELAYEGCTGVEVWGSLLVRNRPSTP